LPCWRRCGGLWVVSRVGVPGWQNGPQTPAYPGPEPSFGRLPRPPRALHRRKKDTTVISAWRSAGESFPKKVDRWRARLCGRESI